MKAKYKCTISFEVYHDVDTLEDLKSDREMASDIACLIMDEVTTANGVGTFEIQESSINVYGSTDAERKEIETPEWKEKMYNKFLRIH